MTRSNYVLARILTAFGVTRTDTYRGNAAYESHLLREAEEILGNLLWKETEDIEDLSTDYWQLRKLAKRHDEIDSKTSSLTEVLESSQDARSTALEEVAEKTRDKVTERDKVSNSIERLRVEGDEVLRRGRTIKRSHEGLKAKLEVLQAEDNDEAGIEKTKTQLLDLRKQFNELKVQRESVQTRLAELGERLKELNGIINEENNAIRERAEQDFNNIGKANKELTNLRSELGGITNEASEIFCEVGQYLLDNQKDPQVHRILAPYSRFVRLTNTLRHSIKRNRSLFE